jgi:prepilin signal peptidase PulO-like enzyme (type II secretory pathway)
VVGPVHRRGYFECGGGLRRWWDGQNWVGPAIAPSSVPWKHTPIAYALLILWGALGAHRFYIRAYVSATSMLGLYLIGAVFLIVGAANQAVQTAAGFSPMGHGATSALPATGGSSVLGLGGLVAFVALAVWLLADLCTLPSLVWALNNKNAARAVQHAAAAPSRDEMVAAS